MGPTHARLTAQGVSLASERAFAFIDGLRLLAEHDDPLDQAYAAVDEKLASFGERSPLILLDDVTAPLWAGGDVNRVFDFYRAIRTLCLDVRRLLPSSLSRQAGASSLAIFRADATFVGGPIDERPHDPADDWLLRACIQRSSVWLQLRAIVHTPGTGEVRRDRCGSADAARIVVHRAPGLGDRHHGLTSSTRARPSQYRLGESGATLFAKGLASGFL